MIAVIGANGFMGRHCAARLEQHGHAVLRMSHGAGADLAVNLAQPIPADLFAQIPQQVTHALLCSSITDIDGCRRDPVGTGQFNVEHSWDMLDGLSQRGIVPIFCSTDIVFPDEGRAFRETDTPNPSTEYGRQKYEVERRLQASGHPFLILRMSKLYSNGTDDTSPVRSTALRLKAGQSVKGATDQTVAPTFIGDIAQAVETLIVLRQTGIFHLSVPPAGIMTRYAMAQSIAHAVQADPALVEACSITDFTFVEKRPHDVRLETGRAKKVLGYDFSLLTDHLPTIVGGLT